MERANSNEKTIELSDNDLNAVAGGRRTFHYVEQNGNTYAVGQVLGQTVKVKLT